MPISRSGERLVVTLGDAAGIGPEVTVKALHRLIRQKTPVRVLLLGKASVFREVSRRLRLKLLFHDSPDACFERGPAGSAACYFPGPFPQKIRRGRPHNDLTRAAVESIGLAARLALAGQADAVVTAPIHKAGLLKAGYRIPGHTEYLARLAGVKNVQMMLAGGPLRVVVVTRHLALKDVARNLTRKGIEDAVLLTDRELRESFGIRRPRLVVCGLNPHAGEEGRFGDEESRIIIPALRRCRQKTSSEIIGPLSPDTVFYDAYEGRYDAEICMYHDQGLIPMKMISRGSGVNVTLGLPFVRTSPDHGTAYDIASAFKADPGSMFEAVLTALRLSRNRRRHVRSAR